MNAGNASGTPARRLGSLALRQLEARRQRLSAAQSRLSLLGPQNVLRRGYSITTDASTGRILRSALQAPPGVLLHTRLADGEILSRSVAPGDAGDAAQPGE